MVIYKSEKKQTKCRGIKKRGGNTAAALGPSTRMASAAAKVRRESPIQYSKLTKRIPSRIQNNATASGVLSAPNTPDSKLMNNNGKNYNQHRAYGDGCPVIRLVLSCIASSDFPFEDSGVHLQCIIKFHLHEFFPFPTQYVQQVYLHNT